MPENKDLQEKIKQLEEEIRILKQKSIERRQLVEQLYQVQKMERDFSYLRHDSIDNIWI